MGEMKSMQMGVIGALFLSVASSVSIVICNKALMTNLGFPFATTLTSWHLMVTYCTLHVAYKLSFFENKPIDTKTVVLFGLLNGISIGLLNLSLGFNSIGFYQMTKLAIIPFTVLLETLFLNKKFSRKIKFSLFLLLVGVGIASITDLQLNFVGSVLSLLAIATTCVGQILTNTIQKRLNVTSTQLLYQSAPFQAAILFVSGPFVDKYLTRLNVFSFHYSPIVVGFITLSCLIAVSVNFSTFLVIGKTSPVTYQVLGHLKTCLVLAFGYTLLHDPFTPRNIAGILIAVLGMLLYSYFCSVASKSKQGSSESSFIGKDRDTTPLLSQEKENHEAKKLDKHSPKKTETTNGPFSRTFWGFGCGQMNNGGSWLPEEEEELKGLSENFFDDLITLPLEEDTETGDDDEEGDWDAKFENLVPPPLDLLTSLSSEFTHAPRAGLLRNPLPTLKQSSSSEVSSSSLPDVKLSTLFQSSSALSVLENAAAANGSVSFPVKGTRSNLRKRPTPPTFRSLKSFASEMVQQFAPDDPDSETYLPFAKKKRQRKNKDQSSVSDSPEQFNADGTIRMCTHCETTKTPQWREGQAVFFRSTVHRQARASSQACIRILTGRS
ncbi:hypothetical protein IGI04_016241 [Brassica rapa subsp. trilocularis]|uniref:GATA-type domain-containing protein n=1 Tax=Brassica rapa subsp. trilocularis TaxID=1813537 RepID=A0ABQ7MSE6_BRACM|nr:hypothetical protein IGI04_016241 [Brassica rapa subsp. trilocularis]